MTVPEWSHGPLRLLTMLAVVLVGGGIGWTLAPPASTYVGPLEVQVEVVPALHPGVHVQLPPVGQVDFDTHRAPVAVNASVTSVDLDSAQQLIGSPQALLALQVTAPQVLRDAVTRAVVNAVLCALLGVLVVALLVYRRSWRVAQSGVSAVAGIAAIAVVAVLTANPAALSQPRFTGLLSRAPYVAGAGTAALERLESYRSGLADFVTSVSGLYTAADRVPVLPGEEGVVTLVHVSDIHLNPLGFDVADRLVRQFGAAAVIDTGDVTTWGTPVESGTLSRIGELGVPYVFVRGNHDSVTTQAAVAAQPNAVVLDGDVAEVAGLTFAGIGDPEFTPEEGEGSGGEARREKVGKAVEELAGVIAEHDEAHPDDPVDVALVHDPAKLDAVFGQVPLVLAGHYHYRIVREDPSGTRVMVEGSTGGAGITAAGLARLERGEPLALTATLLHFATDGDRAGELVAFDQVTVGGLGLTSVTIERTVVPPGGELVPYPDQTETGDPEEEDPEARETPTTGPTTITGPDGVSTTREEPETAVTATSP